MLTKNTVVLIDTNADYIITRDAKGFRNSDIKVISPEDFLQILGDKI